MGDRPIKHTFKGRLRLYGGRLCALFGSGRRLITAAALLHVALAAGLFCAGRAQAAPGLIDRDGIMPSFAFDSYEYQRGAARLVEVLREGGVRAWAAEPEPAHVKLISLQFALLGPLFGYSTWSAEPLNLFCYVAILSLVLALGREVGGRRVGLLAAGVVALWPTFLLHTTQLLKDPLFIAAALTLVLVVTTWLTRTYNWAGAVGTGTLMAASIWLLLLIRGKFALVIFALALFGLALLVVRQLVERRLLYWNMVSPLLVLASAATLYSAQGLQKLKHYPSDQSGQPKSVAGPGRLMPSVLNYESPFWAERSAHTEHAGKLYSAADRAAMTVGSTRYRFNVSYPESGSGIDRDVEFRDFRSLILYLPRAVEIGLWAPFPNTWAGAGRRVGNAGRLLSGAETFIIYLCELLALAAVLRAPRRLAAWLLLSITTFAVTVLGLVVSNVGTLYRFRYPFWLLLIILGAKGFESIFRAAGRRASGALPGEGELTKAA